MAEYYGKTRLFTYQKKVVSEREDHYRAIDEDILDTFHGIQKTQLQAERIIDQYKRGKYFKVKWKNVDHQYATWEHQSYVTKKFPQLKIEFQKLMQSQKLVNISMDYRQSLMRGRDFVRSLHIYSKNQSYKEQPIFINSKNKALTLHDYQVEGLNWLVHSWINQTNVILADEMGLGKTAQTVSFISYMINVQQITRPFLVVCPTSTLDNWVREFQ